MHKSLLASLKELGDIENWARVVEVDLNGIATGAKNAIFSNFLPIAGLERFIEIKNEESEAKKAAKK